MKIAVINGSPKGKYSITYQTVRYLERKYPEHEFEVLHAGQTIKALEKDFTKAREMMEGADALIFSYPVDTFLAPSQLHRFIELTKESEVDLRDKYATQITTSKHFTASISIESAFPIFPYVIAPTASRASLYRTKVAAAGP